MAGHVSADTWSNAPSLDRSLDGEKLSLARKRIIRQYVSERSSLKALRDCGAFYLPQQKRWNSCRHPLCWQCAPHRAGSRAADLRRRAEGYRLLIVMTFAAQSAPSTSLSAAWDALDQLRSDFLGDRWLRRRVDAYRWHTEITQGPQGWHPHVSFLLALRHDLSGSDLDVLERACRNRWSNLADNAGHCADPESQYFTKVRRTPGRMIGYLCKGPMARSRKSRTPGRILLDAAIMGDSDADSSWAEIELASVGRRWQSTGGGFRRQG